MKVEISYANKVYEKAQKFHVRSAWKKGNFDKVITYTEKDIDDEYIAKNEWAFSQERGGGYWIWKSYIISKTLKTLKDGDYLFYCDSGAYFIKPIDILIEIIERDNINIMLFQMHNKPEKNWTKKDIFTTIDCQSDKCRFSNQIWAGSILIRKNKETVNFFEEYLRISQIPGLIDDSPNRENVSNYDGFVENRHDQSILSVLSKKSELKSYRDLSQFGWNQRILYKRNRLNLEETEVYNKSNYPTIVMLPRWRNPNFIIWIKMYAYAFKMFLKTLLTNNNDY